MAENKPAEEIVKKGERAAGNGKTTRLGGQPVASETVSYTHLTLPTNREE